MAQPGRENTWRVLLWIRSILRGGPVGTKPAWRELFLLRQHPVLHSGQALRARFRTGRLPVNGALSTGMRGRRAMCLTPFLYFVEVPIPLDETRDAHLDGRGGFEADVAGQVVDIGIGRRHVTRL